VELGVGKQFLARRLITEGGEKVGQAAGDAEIGVEAGRAENDELVGIDESPIQIDSAARRGAG
jgi:hypothetical protein